MFKNNKGVRHELGKARESTAPLHLRRKVNAFLLPMTFRDPTGDEAIIGDVDDNQRSEDVEMREEPAEGQTDNGAASSRDGPRAVADDVQDSAGTPVAPGLKRPLQ
eukprot:636943-Pyramimonas_sp.AAC.1